MVDNIAVVIKLEVTNKDVLIWSQNMGDNPNIAFSEISLNGVLNRHSYYLNYYQSE